MKLLVAAFAFEFVLLLTFINILVISLQLCFVVFRRNFGGDSANYFAMKTP
jgi:uncharacterized membrane protein